MKQPTQWITQPGYDKADSTNAGFSLLLETGSHLLTETGFKLLLEDTNITTREATLWNPTTKTSTKWSMQDGYSSQTASGSATRLTSQGDTRITEQGDTRIVEDSTFTPKEATGWTEL